ncbi:DUF4236 domain-containing protein [Salsuginibacillus kocurii]|uniref:DUF4236 domain-containing protein n=1 Tax=Salsuginibacillus kocurii TaxID=427078 RepID=UPI0003827858|nr:DUF4236 domain-containing protein [Salsuginibacillus kocurii]
MAIGFRKSKRLGKGMRVNFSKRGAGVSFGGRGLRAGVGPGGMRGRATLPGSGLFYEKRIGKGRARTNQGKPQQKTAGQPHAAGSGHDDKEQKKQAEAEVRKVQEYLQQLRTFHQAEVDYIDWREERDAAPPFAPNEKGPNEEQAERKLERYTPSFWDKLFRLTEKKKAKLQKEREAAKNEDRELIMNWEADRAYAAKIVDGDTEAMKEELESAGTADLLNKMNARFYVQHITAEEVVVRVQLPAIEEVIPTKAYHVTKTGKLSERDMPKKEFYTLWRDMVLSLALLTLREAHAHLHVYKAMIHIQGPDADGSESTIFTMTANEEQLLHLKDLYLPLNELIELFPHRLDFLVTKGLRAVRPFHHSSIREEDG